MNAFLWVSCGSALAAGLIFLAFSLRKPVSVTFLVFALMSLLLSLRFGFLIHYYSVTEMNAALEVLRTKTFIGLGFYALFPVFICSYTGFRPRRFVVVTFYIYLLGLTVYNIVNPYTAQFAVPPHFRQTHSWTGETLNILEAPSTWVEFCIDLTVAVVFSTAVILIIKRRPNSWLLLTGLGSMVLALLIDQTRDRVHGDWPYFTEFSAVFTVLCMALQLALDFRRKDEMLSTTLRATMVVSDQLNTPLQSLTLDVRNFKNRFPTEETILERMLRNLSRLSDLSRRLKGE